MNVAIGSTFNISSLLRFYFQQHVYFNSDDSIFPRKSTEETCRLVGISDNVGHDVIFSILNTATNKVVIRSNVRPEDETTSPNISFGPLTTHEVIISRNLPSVHLENNEEAPAITEGGAPNASTS